jgi:hypothetical protein
MHILIRFQTVWDELRASVMESGVSKRILRKQSSSGLVARTMHYNCQHGSLACRTMMVPDDIGCGGILLPLKHRLPLYLHREGIAVVVHLQDRQCSREPSWC